MSCRRNVHKPTSYVRNLEVRLLNLLMTPKYFANIQKFKIVKIYKKDMESLQKWTQDWQMQFNTDKCKVMHIGTLEDTLID